MDNLSKEHNVQLIEMSDAIDQINELLFEIIEQNRPLLNGDRFISDAELSDILKVSRRTLQLWRNEGKISYIMLGGKVLYRETDVQAMLDAHYCKCFDECYS